MSAAGNKILKPGQVVFKSGDASDGMYIVRKGELTVFLEQEGREVVLAKVGEGGVIGEMALFDKQPRSASVKAASEAEVTMVSPADFAKLMKQIPKWFVTLMTTLSARLRDTNERLKKFETAQGSSAAAEKSGDIALRLITCIDLIWSRDSVKDGKDTLMSRDTLQSVLTDGMGEARDKVTSLIDALLASTLLLTKMDQSKKPQLALANRAVLKNFSAFATDFLKKHGSTKMVSDGHLEILKYGETLVAKNPYDPVTLTFEELAAAASEAGADTKDFQQHFKTFPQISEGLKPVKTSDTLGVGIKTVKAEFPQLYKYLRAMRELHRCGLIR